MNTNCWPPLANCWNEKLTSIRYVRVRSIRYELKFSVKGTCLCPTRWQGLQMIRQPTASLLAEKVSCSKGEAIEAVKLADRPSSHRANR